MKAILCVAVQLMLCIGTMAFVDLVGCERGLVELHKAKDFPWLRQMIKRDLKFEMDDADTIAAFTVHDKDLDEIDHVVFAGNQENGKAVTFIYESLEDGERAPLNRIPYSIYYRYLECEVPAHEEDTES
ncbi:unnamed protein product [Heligmosomoides polygyrus]|uniref:Oncosphere protein n=1 Tax=Heligmosomoides polygyrus TaxID=6339 RepID=A0A183F2E3_HELPZ|nr:unnamed protein product [Heligmosomoides polygyrus]